MKFILHVIGSGGIRGQMMDPPAIEGVVGHKVLLPIDPPLEGQFEPMDCAGAVCIWCDPGRFPVDLSRDGEALSEALFPRSQFPEAQIYVYAVEEYRRRVAEHDRPLGEPSPGFVWFTFMRRLDGITHDEFASRWCDGHWPLVERHHPAVWGYTQNVVTDSLTPNAPYWDGIGELHFKTPEDMRDRMYDSEEGKQIIWNDINSFLNTKAGNRFYAEEVVLMAIS